jgi:peptidoglycan L-alanyl-D-glutamate endopeptidase CwlK
MSFTFGKTSLNRLATCDQRLQDIAKKALEDSPYDFAITCGHRDKVEQDRCCAEGLSKTPWPTSKHNSFPSRAFDFVPVVDGKADWNNIQAFKDVAHHILMTGDLMYMSVRWGGDWNCNGIQDEKFVDMPHIELKG